MKKFLKGILVLMLFIFALTFLLKYHKTFDLNLKDKGIFWNLKARGLKEAIDFTYDGEQYYIAFKDKVQCVDKKGKSYILFKNKELNISSLTYKDNKLFYASSNKVFCYDIINKKEELIMNNLPNFGDYNKSKIFIKDNYMYITIGSATNSGVVGQDNTWVKDNPFNYDITPKSITVKGKNFDGNSTGAFVPYKTKNVLGQIIPAHFPGNSSVIIVNIDTKNSELFAWGIRNIEGIDYDSSGRILATVGGMEDRGLRPIKGDFDYIFEIKQKTWYGWPDYSGGDPIDSPRFKGEGNKKIPFLLDKHPTTNPPAPIYQHTELSSLRCLAIDKKGIIDEKDSILFYDIKEATILSLNKSAVLKEKIKLNKDKSEVSSMKFYDNGLNILDKKSGCIYEVYRKENSETINIEKGAIYCTILIIVMIILAIILKSKKS